MIPILLHDLRWRLAALAVIAWVLYLLEPGFHQHGTLGEEEAVALGAVGISATLSYFAGIAMIVLLAGFVSTDRNQGYTRLYFAHPTRPLAFYGLRLGVAFVLAVAGAAVFLVLGQMVAWGEVRGGWSGLLLAVVTAIVYGGLMTFLSAALPRGDAAIAFVVFMFFPVFLPQLFALALAGMPPALRQAVLVVLPPQGALELVWRGLLDGTVAWSGVGFAIGYGIVWLLLGGVLLRVRDLP